MENQKFCQSCSMPLDDEKMLGTEKDGSKNHQYCSYCYQNGAFVNPNMTLNEMTDVVKTEMCKRHIPGAVIDKAVGLLPHLNRWRS